MRLALAAISGLLVVAGVFAMATPLFSEASAKAKWAYALLLLAVIMWVTYYALAYLGALDRIWIFGGTDA